MTKPVVLRVGTRESALAMAQSRLVVDKLKKFHPDYDWVIVGMTTTGDQILDKSLSKIGGKALFTGELESALSEGQLDLIVHSFKDVPTTLPEGLSIGAILEREDPADAVVFPKDSSFTSLGDLKEGAVVGTSSLRRIAQLRRHYKGLKFTSVRGNLNTRLRKLDDKNYDALILAVSGLRRLGMGSRISSALSPELCLHAVGQGALAIECRSDDVVVTGLIKALNHRETALRCIAERRFMKDLEGGCSVPLGVSSSLSELGVLRLKGGVFSFDGESAIVEERQCSLTSACLRPQSEAQVGVMCSALTAPDVDTASRLGSELAARLLKQGARDLLDKARMDAAQSMM